MAYLENDAKEKVKQHFESMKENITMSFFRSDDCEYCKETSNLLNEVADLSDKIELESYDIKENGALAEKFGVDKTPAIVFTRGDKDYGMRIYGIPTGYEFASLLEAIKMVSTSEVGMPPEFVDQIKAIDKPVHLQVYVSPTCPHCPRAVTDAHRFAFLNENIKAEMVEASEFQELSRKYGVRGVPQIIINEKPVQPGALPLQMFLDEINKSIA